MIEMSSKVLANIAFINPAKEKTIDVSKTTAMVRIGCWTSTFMKSEAIIVTTPPTASPLTMPPTTNPAKIIKFGTGDTSNSSILL
jgi:hypothetical protein